MVDRLPSSVAQALELGPSAVVSACLALREHERPLNEFAEGMEQLARMDTALGWRIAMLLSCVKRMDVTELGYGSFRAFCREESGWGDTWRGQVMALVESDLDLIKQAALAEVLPMREAVLAPGAITADQQEQWLRERPPPKRRRGSKRVTLRGEAAKAVRTARERMRLVLGRPASTREVDAAIVERWRARDSAAEILAEAREPPEPPDHPPLCFDWYEGDPAEALVGPFREPASLAEAVTRIRKLRVAREGRKALVAHAWVLFNHEVGWLRLGFPSAAVYALERLGWSRRTVTRMNKVGWHQQWYPEIADALRQGLDPGRVETLADVVFHDATDWLSLSERVGVLELRRAVQDAKATSKRKVLERYEWARAVADAWQASDDMARRARELMRGPTDGCPANPAAGAPTAGEGHAPTAGEGHAPTAGEGHAPTAGEGHAPTTGERGAPVPGDGDGPGRDGAASSPGAAASDRCAAPGQPGPPGSVLLVALPHDEPEPSSAPMRVHPDLLKASRWFIETVQIPVPPGVAGRVKERDRFRCTNPECGRRCLRNEVHHWVWRSRGGSDDEVNLGVLCTPCHLRGVHAKLPDGRPRILAQPVYVAGCLAILWTYPGGRQVLQFREAP